MIAVFAAIRWLHEFSLMALFGSAMLRVLLRRHLPALILPAGTARLTVASIAIASALVWLGLATAQMAGNPAAMTDIAMLKLTVSQTLFGQVFLARFALLLLLCASIACKAWDSVIALLAGAALVLISVTSHAAEASPAHFLAIGVTSDGLHLLTGGFWIGGLVLLARLFLRRTETVLLAGAVTIFADWGMIAVGILVLTGMLNAASILLGGEGHDMGAYLTVLGTKLVLVLAMIGLALVNHFRLLPAMAQHGSGDRLSSHIRWELRLGLVVVALAALLGLLPPTM